MTDAIIGAGTNLGDRLAHLRRAVRALRAEDRSLRVRAVSPLYESDALVPKAAPDHWRLPYLNLAVQATWDGPAETLAQTLRRIEGELGRAPRARWAPREVDLDLLAFGDLAVATDDLTLPHPGLGSRPFALLPFADLVPGWVFPPGACELAGRTAADAARPWRGTPDQVPFRTRRAALSLSELVGTLNLTPDSFSDGGRLLDPAAALERARAMVGAGATILDLGAESTRPQASAVDSEEEWRRLAPVLTALLADRARGAPPLISVDTRHAATARRAIAAGADWINDVSGGSDPALVEAAVAGGVDLVVMHSLTIPPDRARTIPPELDPVEFLLAWGARRLEELAAQGVDPSRVILDPGIGFGKTAEQSTAILRGANRLSRLGVRVLVGHSRKSFLASWYPPGHPAVGEPAARDFESALLAAQLAGLGVDYVRIHDVERAARALRVQALVGRPVWLG